MRTLGLIGLTTFSVALPALAAAQPPAGGGQQAAGGAPPRPPMTLTTTAFPDGAQIPAKHTQAGDQMSPALSWTNVPPGTVEFRAAHARSRRRAQQDDRGSGALAGLEHSRHGDGTPEGVPKGPELKDGSKQISASGPVYRGPGAPASGPLHHYTFELYALDTKMDVQAGADAWETRTALWKAMKGHILGKAVYVGLFRRPQ